MKQLSLQSAILIAVTLICASSISIALITDDDPDSSACAQMQMFDRPPPPPDMRGGFGRGGPEMGQPPRGRMGGGSSNFESGGRRGNRLSAGTRGIRNRRGSSVQDKGLPPGDETIKPPIE